MRTERFLYARWESGPWLLYDLQQDPYELHNLVDNAAHAADLRPLDEELLAWMERVGDSWSLDWTAPVEDDERLVKYRAFYTVQDYLTWAKSHPTLTPGTFTAEKHR